MKKPTASMSVGAAVQPRAPCLSVTILFTVFWTV